jgi:hypothetical protein
VCVCVCVRERERERERDLALSRWNNNSDIFLLIELYVNLLAFYYYGSGLLMSPKKRIKKI